MGGKVWVMWAMKNGCDMVSMSDQMILGWFLLKGIKVLFTFVYAKCSYYEHRGLWLNLENLPVGIF